MSDLFLYTDFAISCAGKPANVDSVSLTMASPLARNDESAGGW